MKIRETDNLRIGTLEPHDDVEEILKIDGYIKLINDDIFELDNWYSTEATNYLCGLLESEFIENGIELKYIITLDGISFIRHWENEPLFKETQKRLGKIRKLWLSGSHKELNSKTYYIEWALKKKIDISWINYAIDKGQYNQSPETMLSGKERNNLYILIATLHDLLTNYPVGGMYEYPFNNQDAHIFKSQEQLINFIEEKYAGYKGLSKSQLEKVFPKAKALLK